MKMDLNYLKKLIKILDTSNLSDIEIEEEGTKIRLSKPRPKVFANSLPSNVQMIQPQLSQDNISADHSNESVKVEIAKSDTPKGDNIYEVKSPMVGTFYSTPAPNADPYVNVGSNVSPGVVLCIIEAMKLMNEIESEVSGKIVKILVESGQPVEYNQPLFLIEKN
ncbi:MAG TPA: acetyl-CoA carboxylase biotin carboxyl carrier protein [Ignavibacteria bacterium]|nr:acetyl-CoA carboxylase biotin carboxyl carrier protein [Ignavibacteria bacterium]